MEASFVFMIILTFIVPSALIALIVFFLYRFFKHGYVGNVYIYIIATYLLCLLLSLFVNLNKMEVLDTVTYVEGGVDVVKTIKSTNVSFENPFQAIATSLFDALKMMAIAFDKAVINPYFKQGGWYLAFGAVYIASSILALLSTSISVIIFSFKSFWAKFINFLKSLSPKTEVYYIFSEAKVATAAKKLGHVLNKQGHIVIMYISKASLKTQEGTEYRDALINEGFDVKNEAFSEKLTAYIFRNFFYRTYGLRRFLLFPWIYRNRKVTVYGIFDDDDSAVDLADNFRKGIVKNNLFYAHYHQYYLDPNNPNDETKGIADFKKKQRKLLFGPEEEVSKKIDALNTKKAKMLEKNADANIEEINKQIEELAAKRDELVKAREEKEKEIAKANIDNASKALDFLAKYRIFVTYQECDIDIAHNFSGQTLHMINTLSQYDMVSTEFILNNPIVNFLPKKEEKILGKVKEVIDLNEKNIDAFNVSFMGFGNINRPIFEKMTQAYQLWDDYGHKIHYHIYDYHATQIVQDLQNEYLERPEPMAHDAKWKGEYFQKPQLYEIHAQSDAELTSYQALEQNIIKIKNENKGNRFNANGFEIFVISAKTTNTDIQIAKSLRHLLIKYFDENALKKTFIFVRIGSDTIADSILREGANKYVFKQEKFKVSKENAYVAPIIIFGENTNMSDFIERDYETLVKLGKVASAAYDPNKDPNEVDLDWAKMDKIGVQNNMATIYSLKAKLNIIGYDLEVDKRNWVIQERIKKGNDYEVIIPTKDDYKVSIDALEREVNFEQELNYEAPLMKLARLEHNRWLATSYHLYKQGPISIKEFVEVFVPQGKSRTDGREKHVCMTTNKGLQDLYKKSVEAGWTKEKAKKLIYDNDVAIMKKVFETVIELQEKEKSRNGKKE